MENKIKVQAYHGTTYESAVKILSDKTFSVSNKDDDWMGYGIYFWDTLVNAEWWANLQIQKSRYCNLNPAVIISLLELDSNYFFDLDEPKNMEKLITYANGYNNALANKSKAKPNFKSPKEIRNFYCSLYKTVKGIQLMAFSFSYFSFNCAGFPIYEKKVQLCATDNSTIRSIDVKRC